MRALYETAQKTVIPSDFSKTILPTNSTNQREILFWLKNFIIFSNQLVITVFNNATKQ